MSNSPTSSTTSLSQAVVWVGDQTMSNSPTSSPVSLSQAVVWVGDQTMSNSPTSSPVSLSQAVVWVGDQTMSNSPTSSPASLSRAFIYAHTILLPVTWPLGKEFSPKWTNPYRSIDINLPWDDAEVIQRDVDLRKDDLLSGLTAGAFSQPYTLTGLPYAGENNPLVRNLLLISL